MSQDVRELLPLYALGVLDAAESAVVERAVAGDPTLAAELAAYQRTAEGMVAPIAPVGVSVRVDMNVPMASRAVKPKAT